MTSSFYSVLNFIQLKIFQIDKEPYILYNTQIPIMSYSKWYMFIILCTIHLFSYKFYTYFKCTHRNNFWLLKLHNHNYAHTKPVYWIPALNVHHWKHHDYFLGFKSLKNLTFAQSTHPKPSSKWRVCLLDIYMNTNINQCMQRAWHDDYLISWQ